MSYLVLFKPLVLEVRLRQGNIHPIAYQLHVQQCYDRMYCAYFKLSPFQSAGFRAQEASGYELRISNCFRQSLRHTAA